MSEHEESSSLEAQRAQRLKKAEALRERGVNPWGNGRKVEHASADVRQKYGDQPTEEIEKDTTTWSVAGRVMLKRTFGKMAFLVLRDRDGDLQLQVRKDKLGDTYALLELVDLGDIVAASGRAIRTKTGELTIVADEWTVLTKALRPLPEKFHGLSDQETRYRQRYLDLATDLAVRETFTRRVKLVQFIRRFLDERGFLEVETPMMHPLVSGAAARPFITHHNALDMKLYLRIAPELYLKRLVVGGFERVYEINRNFRNEGLSTRHNPEFTMLEFYWAHATYVELMDLTEQMVSAAARAICGSHQVSYQGTVLDFSPGWRRVSMAAAVAEKLGIPEADTSDAEKLRSRVLAELEAPPEERKYFETAGVGALLTKLFEDHVEAGLIQPTFVTHFPTETSPLARKNDHNPAITDRFELFVAGREIANAFSELNDPIDQEERFRKQLDAKAKGAEETMDYDADYIAALEHGLPPAAGEGIGIDRLAMLFTDAASIRDVILFPLLKPRE